MWLEHVDARTAQFIALLIIIASGVGLSREDAARWIGVSPGKFDEMRRTAG
jgi:hypothetical protein